MTHEITLSEYRAKYPGKLSLGTENSYGIEQLRIIPAEGWAGLTITATFHPPVGDPVRVLVPESGLVDVPPEATAQSARYANGRCVFAGVADGVQRISCDLAYAIAPHASVDGAESTATPGIDEQVLAEVAAMREITAETVKEAEEVASQSATAAANSAEKAATSEAAAKEAETSAVAAKAVVAASEQAAAASQRAAATSESNAKASEESAATDATNAAASAAAAAKSAKEAAGSAGAAATSAAEAKAAETAAKAAKKEAENQASDANLAAQNAGNSASASKKFSEQSYDWSAKSFKHWQESSLEALSAKLSAEEAKRAAASVKGVADWNAAEGEAGHVLNRTHWVEGSVVEILPESTLTYDEEAEGHVLPFTPNFEVGKTYTVNWNGTEYTCICQDVSAATLGGTVALGDCSVWADVIPTLTSNGEPFVVLVVPGMLAVAVNLYGGVDPVTLGISWSGEIVHKLDNKFLDLEWSPTLKEVELLPETKVSTTEPHNSLYYGNIEAAVSVEDGQKVVVYWDGERYERTVTVDDSIGGILIAGTRESPKKALMVYPSFVSVFSYATDDYTVSICTMQPNKLPAEYLPESVPVVPTAAVGQTIVVKAVDENGKPTEWECADMGGSGSSGGGGFSLPLLYEATTTEEVRWIDTGDNAFTANHMVMVELDIKPTSSNTRESTIKCAAYTDTLKPAYPWSNTLLCGEVAGIHATGARKVVIAAYRGAGGNWVYMASAINRANDAQLTHIMSSATLAGGAENIKGVIIGDPTYNVDDLLGVGTTLKVWGV